jgi:hypothetical protein
VISASTSETPLQRDRHCFSRCTPWQCLRADARAAGQPFVAAAECPGNRSSSRAGRPGRCGPRRRAGGLRSLVASASCVCPGGGSLGRAGSASSIAGGLWCSAPPRTRVAGPNRVSDSLPNRGSGLIIVSEPSAEATRPVRTGQSAPACSRSSAVRSATPRYAGTRPIRVHTEEVTGSIPVSPTVKTRVRGQS